MCIAFFESYLSTLLMWGLCWNAVWCWGETCTVDIQYLLLFCLPACLPACIQLLAYSQCSARNYRPCFRENQPKRSFSIKWKRAFWACFRENWVYKFGHRNKSLMSECFIGYVTAVQATFCLRCFFPCFILPYLLIVVWILATLLPYCLSYCLSVFMAALLLVWLSYCLSDCLTACLTALLLVWLSYCLSDCLTASLTA